MSLKILKNNCYRLEMSTQPGSIPVLVLLILTVVQNISKPAFFLYKKIAGVV